MQLRAAGREVATVVATGFRLLLAAWPRLLALYLLGAIGRQSVLWLATVASGYNGTIGVLLIPLAPLCVLVSMVMMLRVCGEYLPALPQPEASGWRERLVEDLTLASRVLIPFLAVYAAQGLLHSATSSGPATTGCSSPTGGRWRASCSSAWGRAS